MTGRGAETRERILTAAATVINEKGLAHTTTKEIARAAGCSEAALYKHFRHKEQLFLAVVGDRLRPLHTLLTELPSQAGSGAIRTRLKALVRELVRVYADTLPMGMSLFAEPELQLAVRETMVSSRGGPHKPNEILADYLEEERRLGRLRPDAPADTAADMIVGACFQRALLSAFMGRNMLRRSDQVFVDDLVRTALDMLRPRD